MSRPALSKALGVVMILAFMSHGHAASLTETSPLPPRQLQFTQSGVRFAFASLVFGVRSMVGPLTKLTLTIENDRAGPIQIAATNRPGLSSNPPVAVLNDGRGGVCDSVNNISTISRMSRDPRLTHVMTTIPGRSRIYATFAFERCSISHADVSFMGWFGLSGDGGSVKFLTVPLWGINTSPNRQ